MLPSTITVGRLPQASMDMRTNIIMDLSQPVPCFQTFATFENRKPIFCVDTWCSEKGQSDCKRPRRINRWCLQRQDFRGRRLAGVHDDAGGNDSERKQSCKVKQRSKGQVGHSATHYFSGL